jgi:hypothetical protein
MRTALVLACGALLAAGPAAAQTQRNNSTTSKQGQNSATSSSQTSQRSRTEPIVAGVVTSVDPSGHELTLVAPAGGEVDVARVGQSVFLERGVNLLSVQAPVEKSAQVWIDGRKSSLSDLKEGDLVRAAFDANQQQILNVRAVTPQEMRNDLNKARSDLRATNPGSNNSQQQGNK